MTSISILIGTYTPPAWRVGRRVFCRVRKSWCLVTSFTCGRIPWPRGQSVAGNDVYGIVANADLERAVRTEPAKALRYWFGISAATIWRWRKAFGISATGTPGSAKMRSVLAVEQARKRGNKVWTDADYALLGTDTDDVIAARIGATVNAVKVKRVVRRIPAFRGDRRGADR
jgi:hypothetical protein